MRIGGCGRRDRMDRIYAWRYITQAYFSICSRRRRMVLRTVTLLAVLWGWLSSCTGLAQSECNVLEYICATSLCLGARLALPNAHRRTPNSVLCGW